MFKEITAISKNYAIVKIDNVINDDLLNLNVIFEENNKRILGEIEEIINSEAKITFLGEFINDKFFDGIIRKPSINTKIRIINGNELAELTGYNDSTAMMLGLSPLYNNPSPPCWQRNLCQQRAGIVRAISRDRDALLHRRRQMRWAG